MQTIRKIFRGLLFCVGGLCAFALTLIFGFLAARYLSAGAGLELSGLSVVASGGVLLGAVPLIGFIAAAGICCLIGIGLCAYGVVPPKQENTGQEFECERLADK